MCIRNENEVTQTEMDKNMFYVNFLLVKFLCSNQALYADCLTFHRYITSLHIVIFIIHCKITQGLSNTNLTSRFVSMYNFITCLMLLHLKVI
jgi:hypothetical protein